MKKLLALLMVLCLGMFVVACGPAVEEQPAGDDTGLETPEGGEETPETPAEESSEEELTTLPELGDPGAATETGVEIPDIDPVAPADGS